MSAWRTWQWLCALLVMLAGVGFVGTATAAAAASSSVSSGPTRLTAVALYDYDASSNSAETSFGTAPSDAAARVANGAPVAASTGEVSAPPAVFVAADSGAGDLARAACGGESFTPDTNVVMADGTTKPLNVVKVGDKVEATDTKTGKTTAQTVTQVWVNHDTDLMDVTIKAGGKTSTIQATQHHLFWVPAKHAWVEADRLKTGEALRTDNGTAAIVAGAVVIPGNADMWDLTVADDHDFYVVTTTANILVHNCPTRFGNGGDRAPKAPSARNTDAGSFKTRGQAWQAAQDDAGNYKYATPREECSPTGCHVHLDIYNNQGQLLETRHYNYQGS